MEMINKYEVDLGGKEEKIKLINIYKNKVESILAKQSKEERINAEKLKEECNKSTETVNKQICKYSTDRKRYVMKAFDRYLK
jgi:hypothetical protein